MDSRHANYPQPIRSNAYEYDDEGTFFSSFAQAFTYPFRKQGYVIFAAGMLFFFLLEVLSIVPFLGILAAVFSAGYLASYMMRIVSSSADGHDSLPDWPEFANFYDDIVAPMFRWIAVFVVCLGPAFAFLLSGTPQGALVALAAGLLYLPMALIAVSLTENVLAANPLVVIPAIVRVPGQYLLACVVVGLIAGASFYLQGAFGENPSVIGSAIVMTVSIYFGIVEMRILGLLYYFNDETLNWFGEADRTYRVL